VSRLAIIGSGIAGLGCAHFLRRDFDLTVFETESRPGGHAHTVEVAEQGTGRRLPVDTGFMVYNRVTYPLLSRLFDELGVATQPTAMSFSVRHAASGLEFCGSSLNHLFAQRRNLLRPRFYRMLAAINRFNREAIAALDQPGTQHETLGEYVRRGNYGEDFLNLYLVPMSSAVWSTPPRLMLGFPAATLLRFFHNHGFLGLHTQHPWRTVTGGSRTYVERLTAPWRDRIRLGQPAFAVTRTQQGVAVTAGGGGTEHFDHVILACHADQALRLLQDPRPDEAQVLGAFRYQPNMATLHTDASVMPRTRLAWSSWNYEIAGGGADPATATHYWMNGLQGVSDRENYFVSINLPEAIDPARVLKRIPCEHPLFDLPALAAQPRLPELNAAARKTTETYFAGSYFRYGFHEDALLSAYDLSALLLGRDPWPRPKP
jgi:predicted NAD/FAD-binding protein